MVQRVVRTVWCAVVVSAVAACGTSSPTVAGPPTTSVQQAAVGKLLGTFTIDPGSCSASGRAGGSYVRLVVPSGALEKGPFLSDPDSTCTDKSYILLNPGTDGGLNTSEYQPRPSVPFDGAGNGLANRIIQPQALTGIKLGLSSDPLEPQTNLPVPMPTISVKNGRLTGNVAALTASWNNQTFSQGAPKPDGTTPGLTRPVAGTYEAATHRYSLTWSSQISAGTFNGYAGVWHLEGSFVRTGVGRN